MPLNDAFWDAERIRLREVLYPLVLAAAQEGAQNSLDDLDPDLAVDWDLVNEAVVAWARKHANAIAAQITDTSSAGVGDALADWIESGASLDDLIATLDPLFGEARAEAIAVTEVTNAFAQGNLEAWQASGVVSGIRWMTAQDDLVCEICEPLAGLTATLGGDGFNPEGGEGIDAPPAHPRCRCWLQPVVDLP